MPSIKKDPLSAASGVSLEARLNQLDSKIKSLEQAHTKEMIRREQVEGELTKAQQLLQLVMDTLPEAIFWKDRHSVYLGCNRNFAEDAGIGLPEKIVGKTDYDLPWKKEESDFFRECDRRVMLADKAELGIVEPQLQGDGKQAWVETNKAALHDENGKVIGILGTYQDITVRKQAEIALHELNQKLERQTIELTAALAQLQQSQLQLVQQEKMSALGNLIAGVAHEMNNPVGFLSGNLRPAQDYVKDLLRLIELYQAALPNPGEAIEAEIEEIDLDYVRQDLPKLLRSMGEGINRIRDISTSLRTFSRADQQHKVAFDLKDGLDSTILILKHRLKADDRRPEIEVAEHYKKMPLVLCFPGQLNQVFMNLLANAIDALEESSQGKSFSDLQAAPNRITISTGVSSDEQMAVIKIHDNGIGMTEATRQKVFENLFTTKAVGKGTGLGLAIVHQIIVEKHGGTIAVNSEPGQGTEFVVQIPLEIA